MALPEVYSYDASVYEILVTDAVEGYNPSNPNTAANVGISNQAALNLANRTNWLYTNITNILNGTTIPNGLAPLLSPQFSGTPTTPTPALGDNSLKLANTAFVQGTVNGLAAVNVAGGSNVTLSAVQAGSGILNLTGALTANIAVIVPNASGIWTVENNTTGNFSVTIKTAAGTGVTVAQGYSKPIFCDGVNVYGSLTDFSNFQLSGAPTTPTPPIGDQSLRIANTDFVWQFVDGAVNVPVGGGSNVTLTPVQYGNGILLLQGALTAAIQVNLPAQSGQWIVANQTTGAFGLTIGIAGTAGKTATIPQGQSVIVYSDGTNVILAGAAASSSFSIHTFTATAGQTTFVCPYTPGNILVMQNGSTIALSNFTATDGANVIFNSTVSTGDEIQIVAFSSFTVANAVTWAGGTMQGALQLFGGDTGTTAAALTNSTLLATTAFVHSELLQLGNAAYSAIFGASLAASGYQKLPSGLIIQWLTVSSSGSATIPFTWPVAFPNAARNVQVSSSGYYSGEFGAGLPTTSGGSVQMSAATSGNTFYVFAIGY